MPPVAGPVPRVHHVRPAVLKENLESAAALPSGVGPVDSAHHWAHVHPSFETRQTPCNTQRH